MDKMLKNDPAWFSYRPFSNALEHDCGAITKWETYVKADDRSCRAIQASVCEKLF